MLKTELKRFAQEARNILMKGVAQRLSTLGITADSITERPQVMGGGATFQGKTVTLNFVKTWQSIAHNVESRGYRVVVEEAAYTWFNRLAAIRIMAKNGLVAPLLRFESESVHIPYIVSEARHGRLPQFTAEQQAQWDIIANDDSKTDEQFMLLISAWCDNNPIIRAAFGGLNDYSSLLIPSNILKDDGFVDMLNHTDYLTDDDYCSPELIGWLYQFYISERKDEVFAKRGKYDSDEIPAATQIFTPNWIVKYMVQNTLGRIYLDANPWETELQKDWKYLVDTPEGYDERKNTRMLDLENLRTGDLACGSGHILNEQFGILYSMYINDGYSPRNAIETIFCKNLIGIDIDLRAKQLATFSLLLKSCQIDKSLSSAPIVPRVYSMPYIEAVPNIEYPNPKIKEEVEACFKLMLDAETLGSIMKFDISPKTREYLVQAVADFNSNHQYVSSFSALIDGYKIILILTEKYDAIVMNPPYMPCNKIDSLNQYVNENYKEGKTDLFAVFMQVCMDRLRDGGRMGMINMQSWMFLSSFEDLRKLFVSNYTISSMLHLGPHTFDELTGEVVQNSAFVICNKPPQALSEGTYFRLVSGKNCSQKESLMFIESNKYPNVPQSRFKDIPGFVFGYWSSDVIVESFKGTIISQQYNAVKGLDTCDNERFVRDWYEVNIHSVGFNINTTNETYDQKWFPYCKGGGFRKWAGLNSKVVNWENDGEILRELRDEKGKIKSRPQNTRYYFLEGLTWNSICTGSPCMRYMNHAIFGGGGSGMFGKDGIIQILGFLNSKVSVYILNIINPTLNILVGDLVSLPLKDTIYNPSIKENVQRCISISKADWDAHETSWDFQENEIVGLNTESKYMDLVYGIYEGTGIDVDLAAPQFDSLEWRTELIKAKWTNKFERLHANEEELNRRFIEIYGLQDELDYHVPFDEITILQQGEIDHEKTMPVYTVGSNGEQEVGYRLHWNDDVIIKQLISYAVGCMMGRYSIDKPGLILANQGDSEDAYYQIVYGGPKSSIPADQSFFEVDDDGIVPLMSANLELTDNAPLRFKKWLEATFGAENLVENINFLQQALGKTIEAYFQKDFWKDHKKMYQNRPIYWLFTSKKGAFQCLVYMHRMDAYTPERIRTRYLLPHIDWLKRRQDELQQRASSLNTTERRELDNITKQIEECLEYHDRLHVIADAQQAIDLDDGVAVNYAKFGDVVAKLK